MVGGPNQTPFSRSTAAVPAQDIRKGHNIKMKYKKLDIVRHREIFQKVKGVFRRSASIEKKFFYLLPSSLSHSYTPNSILNLWNLSLSNGLVKISEVFSPDGTRPK